MTARREEKAVSWPRQRSPSSVRVILLFVLLSFRFFKDDGDGAMVEED